MRDNLSDLILFKDLTEDGKKILCKTLAKVYTKQYLNSASFQKLLKTGETVRKIELGLPENFTIGGYFYLRYGWIPDEKFKVFTNEGRYTAVWLDIKVGLDSFFDKAIIDTMNYVAKRPDDLVFSCVFYPDFENQKINIHLYHLHPDKGWEKIATFTYSSTQDFNLLSPYERGQIGEALGTIFAKGLLISDRFVFFPELNNDPLFVENCVFPRRSEMIKISRESWIPDAIFQIFSNPDASELKYEFTPKKVVYIEVKTGKNAKLERYQKDDIFQYSKLQDTIVLLCEILHDSSTNTIKLTLKKMLDGEWKTIKTFNYSDF